MNLEMKYYISKKKKKERKATGQEMQLYKLYLSERKIPIVIKS